MKRCYILAILCSFGANLCAKEYTGHIIDVHSRKAIPSVNIYIKNSTIGTTTDANGHFVLKTDHQDGVVVFDHIGYEKIEKQLAAFPSNMIIELIPIVIPTEGVQIESEYEPIRIARDLPQSYTIIKNESFEARGYTDAGDLLKTEQSIQIHEEFSGQKTVSMRSGNADDVIILYDGVRMNNSYDNTFDLSLLNLDDVQHIEVIKGSHSSLYGSEGFSGIINVAPKTQRDYYVKFQQRFGSYNSGVWNAQFNYTFFNRLNLFYMQKRGGAQRKYSEAIFANDYLENNVLHHSANVVYNFSPGQDKNKISFMYLRTQATYENSRHFESLENLNEMISASYNGDIGMVKRMHVVSAFQTLAMSQFIWAPPNYVDRQADNRSLAFNADKRFLYKETELLLGYQLEDAALDFSDKRQVIHDIPLGIEKAKTTQLKQGFVAIAKLHAPTGSPVVKNADFDISYRYDAVQNNIDDMTSREGHNNPDMPIDLTPAPTKDWRHSTIKFSSRLSGKIDDLTTDLFLNNGTNVKFPSLFQQLSTPLSVGPNAENTKASLNPEKTNGLEIGLSVHREIQSLANVDSWQLNANYFKNDYENKFRMYYLPGIPMAFYDNVQTARISGFELTGRLKLFGNKISVEVGASDYNVSSKSAFPFKSDFKAIFNLGFAHRGSSALLHWFYENEQVGWVRDAQGSFYEIILPGHANMDIHVSKSFPIAGFVPYLDLSIRNVLDDDTTVEGIAIRDRRIYVTFGAQY